MMRSVKNNWRQGCNIQQNDLNELQSSQFYNIWRMQNLQKELEHAFSYFEQHDNQSIKSGQALLSKLRSIADYPILLLTFMKNADTYVGKLRAAIQLRIWCQNYKNMEQFERDSYQRLIENIKENILFAFLSFSDKIQQTLLPGIVSLSAVQFPENWGSLVPGLITYSTQNPESTLKILQLMAQITNKYSYLTRSDELYNQIIYVCDNFHDFLLNLTHNSIQNIVRNQNNPDQMKILENQMVLFYNLNYQDLHPSFEANLKQWMQILNRVMKLPDSQIFFKCKGAALQSILLYASKYKEDVEQSIKGFSQQIWSLCADASPDPQYDDIVFNSLKYFRSLIMWQDMREFFANNISKLISNLIVPNLAFNASYKELFNQDIETFLSYFFRNAEINSRRAAAIQLLQSIVRNYKNFEPFIQEQVKGFIPAPDIVENQCLLLSLVIQSAAKGFRDVDGVTQLQINENIIIYCYQNLVKHTLNIIYEISHKNTGQPIEKQMNLVLLITTLRFIFYFRIFLPPQELDLILQLCCGIHTKNDSLKQVLLLQVNSLVTLKHGNFSLYKNLVYYYDEQKLRVVAGNIFEMIKRYDQQDTNLNASLNKLLYSTIKQLKQSNEQFYDGYIGDIIKSMLCKTKNFIFNSVLPLFQALGFLTYYLCLSKSKKCADLEYITRQYFHQMMNTQSDLLNFCFQLLSIFLQFNPGDIGFYENVYNSIIMPNNWCEENLSIMSSYLQYIAAFITLNNGRITTDKQAYEKILTKLIQLDHYQLFYRLLRRILKLTDLEGFYKSGYMHVLTQGTQYISAKSLEGRKLGILFVFEITFEYNTSQIVNCFNAVQPGFFQNLLINSKDIIQTMQVFRSRKMMFGSICNALVTKCFSTVQNQALMLNLLIENITGRFKRDNFMSTGNENAPKLESTYQKLAVFKEIQNIDTSISLDEQMVLVQAYTYCYNNNHDITNLISQKNLERIKKLYDRQQSKGSN